MTDYKSNEQLPDELIAQLVREQKRPATITARVDRSVLSAAAEQFATRPARRRVSAWYAVAASMLLAVFAYQFIGNNDPRDLLYTDVDGSGKIDIADVMTLASRHGDVLSTEELDAFAMRIVSLGDSS